LAAVGSLVVTTSSLAGSNTPPSANAQTINSLLALKSPGLLATSASVTLANASGATPTIAALTAAAAAAASSQQASQQSVSTIVGPSQNPTTGQSKLAKLENVIVAPRPLFDKTNTALVKLRRDIKMQKIKGWPTYKIDLIRSTLPVPPEANFGSIEDWLPNDDFIILYVMHAIHVLMGLVDDIIHFYYYY
jgi:hypothetical protein